jgi:hypothetical protein
MKRSINDNPVHIEDNGSQCCLFGYNNDSNMTRRVEEPDREDMDKVLAQEVHNLSLQERNRVYEEIHGVAEPLQEEPDFIAQRLSELSLHLSTIQTKKAYDFAFQQSPEYVNDRALCLQFLRSNDFDTHKAAQKLVACFDFKMELFGQEKLAQNITLDDLYENDLTYLRSGAIQILPATDRIGRQILFVQYEMVLAALALDEKSVVCKCNV